MSENGQAEPLLVAERVRKVYRTGGVHGEARQGRDLEVPRGALGGGMGPSGEGPTTRPRVPEPPLHLAHVAAGARG